MNMYYSIASFIIVLISGCILNLLKRHFIYQLAGIAFIFTFYVFRSMLFVQNGGELTYMKVYSYCLPALTSISACLISMVLGFWLFPPVRKYLKD